MVCVEPLISWRKLSCGVGENPNTRKQQCIYLCGNSLGLQPRRTADRIAAHLGAWATKGVLGHFKPHEDSELPPFVDLDDIAAQRTAPIVGAMSGEVAVMETLSANLHLMLASFYQPTKEKFKIIIEGKAFPSDHVSLPNQDLDSTYQPWAVRRGVPDKASRTRSRECHDPD